ncbi:MAG: ParA family protein [Candidatus Sedimenticola sp. (ex Thyasira tokunagai)]
MHTIMVLNAKGGSGKTTIATTLACYFAGRGYNTSLMDYDPQNSSAHWLSIRNDDQPKITSIDAVRPKVGLTRSFQLYGGSGTDITIMDTPAGVAGGQLSDLFNRADTIIIPIMASVIDLHAARGFVTEMMRMVKHRLHGKRIGLIANRVRSTSGAYESIEELAEEAGIPLITSLGDSVNYTIAMESGIGICEQKHYLKSKDYKQWEPVYEWLMDEIPVKELPIETKPVTPEPEKIRQIAEQCSWDFSETNLAMS